MTKADHYLKGMGKILVRIAEPNDAKQLVNLIEQVEKSNFMLFGPGERKISIEQQMNRINAMKEEKSSAILVAEDNGQLAGYLVAIGGNPTRAKHAVYLVIGIEESSRGQGIGTGLFTKVEEWAKDQGVHRLELTVMVHNEAGIALYKKKGFEIEGVKKHSLFIEGKYVDEYYMAKLI